MEQESHTVSRGNFLTRRVPHKITESLAYVGGITVFLAFLVFTCACVSQLDPFVGAATARSKAPFLGYQDPETSAFPIFTFTLPGTTTATTSEPVVEPKASDPEPPKKVEPKNEPKKSEPAPKEEPKKTEEPANTLPIVSVIEEITIVNGSRSQTLDAKLDTGAFRTSIDEDLAERLRLKKTGDTVRVVSASGSSRRELVEITYILAGKEITTTASLADRSGLEYDIIIGRRDMDGFLLTP